MKFLVFIIDYKIMIRDKIIDFIQLILEFLGFLQNQ